jgi:hypothetical protein
MAMPTAETTPAFTDRGLFRSAGLPAESIERSDRLFGWRGLTKAWQSQNFSVRRLLAPPLSATDADVAAVTKIRHDEVTLARVSRTPGRVVISLSDEQAEQIKRITEGD